MSLQSTQKANIMNIRKELPIILLVILPFLYLAFIYVDLPETIPTHWNAKGEIDAYGTKSTLWFVVLVLIIPIYILMSLIPKIDPKGQIKKMGEKFYNLKFILMLFISAIAMYIIYATQNAELSSPKIVIVLTGILIAVMGNYMPSIKPNYFMGLRTPWTLESQYVWKRTHRLAGKLWFFGGLAIVVLSLLLPMTAAMIGLGCILGVLVIVPLAYSYVWFKEEEKKT